MVRGARTMHDVRRHPGLGRGESVLPHLARALLTAALVRQAPGFRSKAMEGPPDSPRMSELRARTGRSGRPLRAESQRGARTARSGREVSGKEAGTHPGL